MLGFAKSVFLTPPCIFKARIVATITTQDGSIPAKRHFISMNFSAPKSAANPASVITKSAKDFAQKVALILLHP